MVSCVAQTKVRVVKANAFRAIQHKDRWGLWSQASDFKRATSREARLWICWMVMMMNPILSQSGTSND